MTIALGIIVAVETVALIILLIVLFRRRNSQQRILNKAETIVKGKLNVEDINTEGIDDATAMVGKAFNSIKSNLMTFVETTKVNVVTLSDAVDVLSQSVEANQQGNEQIAEGATNVAIKTAEQLDLVKDNLSLIESNNAQMQEIDGAMHLIKGILDDTVKISRGGLTNLEGYEKDMEAMSSDLNRINEILARFNSEIKRIEEVGDFIVGISEQLRLLAFNASIEAARAGQAGRGFTVVADEMNVMSAKTKDGMDTINQILKEIISSSKMVNDSIANCENTYNRSKDTFETVNSSFRSINEQSFDIHDKMNSISGMFEIMTENSDKSRTKAENLYETSQAISENTHEIAAVSQQVAAESSKIGENTEALNGMLEGIQNLLKQFDTAILPVSGMSPRRLKIVSMSMFDHEFWYSVRKGTLYAQKELQGRNVDVEYYPITATGDAQDEYVRELIRDCIDRNVDGIIFPGFLTAANRELKEAISRGIKVMAYNCDCTSDIKRISCLCPDSNEPGILAAKETDKVLNKHGNVLMLTGNPTVHVNVQRSESFKKQLANYKGITIVDEITVPDNDEEVCRLCKDCLRNNPDVNVVFITNGFPLSVVRAIKEVGKQGQVKIVCFDHNQDIFRAIKDGIIAAAIGQDAFGQGHDPVINMYNTLVTGEKLDDFIPCRLSVVSKQNVDSLIEA